MSTYSIAGLLTHLFCLGLDLHFFVAFTLLLIQTIFHNSRGLLWFGRFLQRKHRNKDFGGKFPIYAFGLQEMRTGISQGYYSFPMFLEETTHPLKAHFARRNEASQFLRMASAILSNSYTTPNSYVLISSKPNEPLLPPSIFYTGPNAFFEANFDQMLE